MKIAEEKIDLTKDYKEVSQAQLEGNGIWVIILPCIDFGNMVGDRIPFYRNKFTISYGFKKPKKEYQNAGMEFLKTPKGYTKIFRSMKGAIAFATTFDFNTLKK
jgi:hypothetical protein